MKRTIDDWALAAAVGCYAIFAFLVLMDDEGLSYFGKDAVLQAVATLVGSAAAFFGISWQIRDSGKQRITERQEHRLRIAESIVFEVQRHLMVAAAPLDQDAERAMRSRTMAGSQVVPARRR